MFSSKKPAIKVSVLVPVLVAFALALLGLVVFTSHEQLFEQRRAMSADADRVQGVRMAKAASRDIQALLVFTRALASDPAVAAFCRNPSEPDLRRHAEFILEQAQAENKKRFAIFTLMHLLKDPANPLILHHGGDSRTVPYGAAVLDSIGGASVAVGGLEFNYVKAIDEGAPAFISEARPGGLPGLPPVFFISVPVRDSEGRTVAALAAGVRLEAFHDNLVDDFPLDAGLAASILDQRGYYIGSARRQDILNNTVLGETARILENISPTRTVSFVREDRSGAVDCVAVPVSFPQDMASSWWVLLQRPEASISAAIRPERNTLLAIFALGAALLACLGGTVLYLGKRETRQALEEKENECWDKFPGSAPYPVFIISSEGVITDANPAASVLFGFTREEFSGRLLSSLLPDLPPGVLPDSAPGLKVTGMEENIFSARNIDNETIFVRALSHKLDSGENLLFTRDVTDLVQQHQVTGELSRELQQAYKKNEILRSEADKANRAKHDFLANMSHGIRTPLNALLGMSHLLLGTGLNERQRNYAEKAGTAARSLLRVIDAIMDFARIEAGKMDLEVVPVNLPDILESLRTRFDPACREKGITLEMRLEDGVPVGLMGDPVRLRQILGHLISNAVNFTHSGGISLDCRLEERGNSMATLRFTVKDSGVGIPEDQLDLLFNPFTQAENLSTRQYSGAGLGLVICRRMMELMGGSISVQSAQGKGSIFTLHCPFVFPVGEDEAQAAALAGSMLARIEDPDKAR